MQIKLWLGALATVAALSVGAMAQAPAGSTGQCIAGRFHRSMHRRHVFNSSEEGWSLWRSQGRPDLVRGNERDSSASVPS